MPPLSVAGASFAALLSDLAGKPVQEVQVDDEAMTQGMVVAGLPEPVARGVAAFGAAARDGHLSARTDIVRELTGTEPQPKKPPQRSPARWPPAAVGDELTGDLIVLAVHYGVGRELAGRYTDQLDGKVVIDISNAVDFSTFEPIAIEEASERLICAGPSVARRKVGCRDGCPPCGHTVPLDLDGAVGAVAFRRAIAGIVRRMKAKGLIPEIPGCVGLSDFLSTALRGCLAAR